jgi:hypothetical protein
MTGQLKTYRIGGIFAPEVVVMLPDPPPCLYCDTPVTSPSCDGPIVCAPCDLGQNTDGSRWSDEDYTRLRANANAKIVAWRSAMTERP